MNNKGKFYLDDDITKLFNSYIKLKLKNNMELKFMDDYELHMFSFISDEIDKYFLKK